MPLSELMNSELYTWVIIPLLIFCARVVDVSFGTIRIVYISRGKKSITFPKRDLRIRRFSSGMAGH